MAVYMIRASGFGREYSEKLYMVLFILAMILFDSYEKNVRQTKQEKEGNKTATTATATTSTSTSRTSEYWFILLVGSLWWAILEGIIAFLGTRDITRGTLFGHPIPFWVSSLLRGSAEGGSVAVGAIFFSDRMFAPASISWCWAWLGSWHLIYITLLFFGWWAQYQGQEPEMLVGSTEIASRRSMFSLLSIIYGGFVISTFIWYAYHLKRSFPKAFVRQWRAFCIMEFFAAVWSIAQFQYNLRWIEVDNIVNTDIVIDEDNNSKQQWIRASPFIEIAAFMYDIVAEIGIFYIPFYAIPWYYKGLQDEHPLYGSDRGGNKQESKKQ